MKQLITLIVVVVAGMLGVPSAAASVAPAVTTSDPAEVGPQLRVVGGGIDDTPEVGWVAALAHQGFYVCSGSLVSSEFVLTAAHCVRGTRPRHWTVRVNTKDRARGGVARRVSRILEFPGYMPALDYGDMALLRLRAPVEVEPVGLVRRGTLWTGEAGYLAGWGQTSARNRKAPRLLQSAWVPIRADRVCRHQYGWGFHGGVMICAGVSGVAACMGDSGGPLARHVDGAWRLIGVTSFGKPRCNQPGGFAWVGSTPLRSWLRKQLDR